MSLYAKGRDIPPPHSAPKGDNILLMANRLFLRHVVTAGGLGAALKPSQKAMEDLAREFSSYIIEGDELATPAEFYRLAILALERHAPIDPATKAGWESRMAEPTAKIPFRENMAIPTTAPLDL